MNLTDLNYLEPVFENKVIVGGISTYAATDNTLAVTSASTASDGNGVFSTADAYGLATGYDTSVYGRTKTLAHAAPIFNVGIAIASVGATSFGPSGYEASHSTATSLTISNSYGHITTQFAFSGSVQI